MNSVQRSVLFITAFIAFASAVTGCKNQNSQSRSPVEKPQIEKNINSGDVGFTLPVLDALFYEDSFAKELKSTLQLSDEQIQELKEAARASVADLTDDGDYAGSARQANSVARERLTTILGEQKANELLQFISSRYANSEIDGLLPSTPNAVPTDTRVVVNAPAFRMDVFQDGKLLKSYRIGIGYPEFPLPTGMRRATNVIFNPTWTPPDEPWVKGKVQPGQKVAAGSKLNPLGPIKIPIGLPSLIHGGKAPSKLGNFASHGCVGMTDEQVQDFTALLARVSGTTLSSDSIADFEKRKTKTKTVKLTKPVPVELRYETIVAENGVLHIYRDVYERGTNTPENLKRILEHYGINYDRLSQQEQMALQNALQEMNLDKNGEPIADVYKADTSDASVADKKEKTKKDQVTRSVKGKKEVIVPLPALNTKGYVPPIALDTGTKVAIDITD